MFMMVINLSQFFSDGGWSPSAMEYFILVMLFDFVVMLQKKKA